MKNYPKINTGEFWIELSSKIISSFASVKIWGFVIVLWVASYLCWHGKISGDNWSMVVSIGFSGFIAAREYGKK